MDLIAAHGSVAAFATSVGPFVDKDVAVVRAVADDLGTDLGPIKAAYRAMARRTVPIPSLGGQHVVPRPGSPP